MGNCSAVSKQQQKANKKKIINKKIQSKFQKEVQLQSKESLQNATICNSKIQSPGKLTQPYSCSTKQGNLSSKQQLQSGEQIMVQSNFSQNNSQVIFEEEQNEEETANKIKNLGNKGKEKNDSQCDQNIQKDFQDLVNINKSDTSEKKINDININNMNYELKQLKSQSQSLEQAKSKQLSDKKNNQNQENISHEREQQQQNKISNKKDNQYPIKIDLHLVQSSEKQNEDEQQEEQLNTVDKETLRNIDDTNKNQYKKKLHYFQQQNSMQSNKSISTSNNINPNNSAQFKISVSNQEKFNKLLNNRSQDEGNMNLSQNNSQILQQYQNIQNQCLSKRRYRINQNEEQFVL
ncbi:hypothetical protein PPERSA_10813 [Pseudocohnilembus persalinus]|uniref:Uncharacterized protein n=1 Tax=Pseudocohnilembus persalinus TaxID=266149 RepID=A0A0V0QDN4_PSEPJ|nr:hypothetical protein PPERSA_10813 [Pseudocohnilembus persalinus]|eukprot:KRX00314.1 hypothetical protein PPERSA_10813 [Pseudocohnilembus persalinus]